MAGAFTSSPYVSLSVPLPRAPARFAMQMVKRGVRACLLLVACAAVGEGHGSMIIPRPRNSIDGALPIFDRGGCQQTSEQPNWCYACNCGSYMGYTDTASGAIGTWDPACKPGARAAMNGQGCLWFVPPNINRRASVPHRPHAILYIF